MTSAARRCWAGRNPAPADLRTIPYAAEGDRLDAWRLDVLVNT
ncbi:hypothetical protein [Sphaerisporangium sp. NPDC051011]